MTTITAPKKPRRNARKIPETLNWGWYKGRPFRQVPRRILRLSLADEPPVAIACCRELLRRLERRP